jgi:hypothetical protein
LIKINMFMPFLTITSLVLVKKQVNKVTRVYFEGVFFVMLNILIHVCDQRPLFLYVIVQ